jgi:hypothetical protein
VPPVPTPLDHQLISFPRLLHSRNTPQPCLNPLYQSYLTLIESLSPSYLQLESPINGNKFRLGFNLNLTASQWWLWKLIITAPFTLNRKKRFLSVGLKIFLLLVGFGLIIRMSPLEWRWRGLTGY